MPRYPSKSQALLITELSVPASALADDPDSFYSSSPIHQKQQSTKLSKSHLSRGTKHLSRTQSCRRLRCRLSKPVQALEYLIGKSDFDIMSEG